jgi:hypothetical protein
LAGGDVIRLLTRWMDRQTRLNLIQKTEPKPSSMKTRIPALSRRIDLAIPTSNHPFKEGQQTDTLHWYSRRYPWKHSFSEVVGWCRSLGVEGIERLNVRGRQPIRNLIGEDADIFGQAY